ncbi:hypothetical protein N9C16_04815 [Paracoccaceae bacterium]|jgi:hypothetical protein|nr:hypothetical protein [Paracoccaceae bacterium]
MDPFTLALATFGVQKLRGKSTRTALKDAALIGGGSQLLGMTGAGQGLGFKSFGSGAGQIAPTLQGLGQTTAGRGITSLIGKPDVSRAEAVKALGEGATEADIASYIKESGSGFRGMGTLGKVTTAATLLPFLEGEEEPVEPPFTEEDYEKAYAEQAAKLEGAFVPASSALPARSDVYGSNMFYANQGGLAEVVKKFNTGGINYLPSKSDHDENDANNYIRATGYVEDGAGNGDKDEDTMLAQLADGEFVSRADAVLGAGILSGADPKSFKSMRKAGADFFYDQQKKFKRIYDLINASKQN